MYKILMKDIDILISTIVIFYVSPENIRSIYKNPLKERLRILISGIAS